MEPQHGSQQLDMATRVSHLELKLRPRSLSKTDFNRTQILDHILREGAAWETTSTEILAAVSKGRGEQITGLGVLIMADGSSSTIPRHQHFK